MIPILLSILTHLAHSATSVQVNVDSFTGIYTLDQNASAVGSKSFVLDSGDHVITFANNAKIYFHVDTNDFVTSHNTVAATGGSGSLNMNTLTVSVDPKNYQGYYSLNAGSLQALSINPKNYTGQYMLGNWTPHGY